MFKNKKTITLALSLFSLFFLISCRANLNRTTVRYTSGLTQKHCQKKLRDYYSTMDNLTIRGHCTALIMTAQPALKHCSKKAWLLAISKNHFANCIIRKLRRNRPFLRTLHILVMQGCMQKILSLHPNTNRHQMHINCQKNAVYEMNALTKYFAS